MLPNAEQAIIDPVKLHGYLLSHTHPIGRFKARFFESLGFTAQHYEELETALRNQHLTQPAKLVATTKYGWKYEIRAILKGPTERTSLVSSIWMMGRGHTRPRFVTAYPADDL